MGSLQLPRGDTIAVREAHGKALRAWREGLGMSRRELAEKLGATPAEMRARMDLIKRWEDGYTFPKPETRAALAALSFVWGHP